MIPQLKRIKRFDRQGEHVSITDTANETWQVTCSEWDAYCSVDAQARAVDPIPAPKPAPKAVIPNFPPVVKHTEAPAPVAVKKVAKKKKAKKSD